MRKYLICSHFWPKLTIFKGTFEAEGEVTDEHMRLAWRDASETPQYGHQRPFLVPPRAATKRVPNWVVGTSN